MADLTQTVVGGNQLEKATSKPPGIYSPEEEKCLIFSKGNKIGEADEIELRQLIMYLLNLTGVNSDRFPDKIQMIVLLDFMRLTYPGNTIQEVKLAFQMSMAGKLECDNSHYQNFSANYFGQTMAAYRIWAAQVHDFHDRSASAAKQIEYKDIEMTDEELLKATYETWKVIKKPDFIPESLYYYLEKEGLIRLSNDQKRGIMARVSPDGDVKAMCRKVAVSDYFKTLL